MAALNDDMRQRIEAHLPRYPDKQAVTLPALHIVQDEKRCVSDEAMREIAALLDLHPSQISDTASFYGFFRSPERPLGRHRVWVCRSLSCMLRGGEELLANLCKRLNVEPGGTTSDGKITLEFAECLGMCEGAPCILVDDVGHMDISEDKAERMLSKLPT